MSADPTPRVFISYAHDSDEHRDRVLRFAAFLRTQGIDTVLDTWCEADAKDWYAWAIRELTGADYVLVIASPRYRQVGDGSGPNELHRGVQSEAALLRELIYSNRDGWRQRVLPVLLHGHGPDEIPLFLQPHSASRYVVPAFTVADATPLLRVLLRQPEHLPPPIAAPPSLPPADAPLGWGAFDLLPAPVQDLLRAQESNAAELPYRLRGARQHTLGDVYVRQDLGTGTDTPQPEQPRTEPYRDGKIPVSLPEPPTIRLVVRPPARPIRAALDADDHLLITGGPGQGKSTLSLRLTADILTTWKTAPDDDTAPLAEPVIPLRLTARVLATRRDMPFAHVLAECVRVEYGGFLATDVSADLLADRVAGRRWLLLVDGLDEVANAGERDRLVKVLAARAGAASPYRVVLTTRPIEGAALAPFQQAGAARYELEPFDEAALQAFARNWFRAEGPDTADRFVRQVRAADLDELVRVPLLATIAAIIFTERRDVPLPDNQFELYEAYLEYLRSGRVVDDAGFEQLRTPLLEHLGRVRLETDAPLLPTALDWYAGQVAPPQRPPTWRDDLATFLTAVGLLALRGDELRFLHHSFAEHLAATSMARDLPPEFDAAHVAFTHLLHTSRAETTGRYPRTVLLHYTRLRPDQADRLVQWLHAGTANDHLLAARLLAKHAPASIVVVDGFLATARAWAMTSQYPGSRILDEITRATHHPGLSAWLVGLSIDDRAPWPSRVIAARALARRPGEPHADTAADLLETVVRNEELPVTPRLEAAEGLVDCGLARRPSAEQALRLVLADPATPATGRRSATVILGSLGPAARAHAVRTLLAALDDLWTARAAMIEAASALAEIGLEFHDRCTTVFRSILCTTQDPAELRDATRGLAALGPQFVAEAADALAAFAANRANNSYGRTLAAEALRELGPLFAVTAGQLVLGMLAEPVAELDERDQYARTLARLGPDHREMAAAYLTARLDDLYDKDSYSLYDGLIELGPEFHDLAAQLLRQITDDPLTRSWTRIIWLGRLAVLSQADRAPACDRLQRYVSDRRVDLDTRIAAARQLARLGPEFHPMVVDFLITAVTTDRSADSNELPYAWGLLADLATEHRDLAASRLHDLLRSDHLSRNSMLPAAIFLTDLGADHRASAATQMTAILTDVSRPDAQCVAAAEMLARYGGGEYDRIALRGLLAVLRREHVDLGSGTDLDAFCSLGAGPRRQLADALRVHLSDPNGGPSRTVRLATAIATLSEDHMADAIEALDAVVADDTARPWPRFDAGVALVALNPLRRADVVAAIERCVHPVNVFWTLARACPALAKLGHDATSLVRAVLADGDTERELRATAVALLPDLDRDAVDLAADELRSQLADDHLDAESRGDIHAQLAKLDRTAVESCLSFHNSVLDDEDQAISVRCYAAEQVVQFDRARWPDVVALLRRLLTDPLSTPAERLAATQCLASLNAVDGGELRLIAAALVSDPAARSAVRQGAITLLDGRARLDAQRRQLTDHHAWITNRIPQRPRDRLSLAVDIEEVIRDVLAGPETSIGERISAAVALAGLAFRLMPEAVGILTEIATVDTSARFEALSQLAWLDGPSRPEALRRVTSLVVDEALPTWTRRLAAECLMDIDSQPNPAAIDFLRAVAKDETTAQVCRIGAMYALRHVDGPQPMRALRDDPRRAAAVRVEAATQLIGFTVDDRAAAAACSARSARLDATPPHCGCER